jgi:hypothetical protein
MIYLGDSKGYTQAELKLARKIRQMSDFSEQTEAIKTFKAKYKKMFPMLEPGTHMKPNLNAHSCLNHIRFNMDKLLLNCGKLF